MNRFRARLIAIVLAATIVPLAATIWIATSLIDRSLGYETTADLDRLSRTLETTGRQFYQRERDSLQRDVSEGRLTPDVFSIATSNEWPADVTAFWTSGESARVSLAGTGGDHLALLRRTPAGVERYQRDLGGIHLEELSQEFGRTRALVSAAESRDLKRGFTLTLLVLIAVVWLISLAPLFFLANRVGDPIQRLTEGLNGFAAGDWDRRLERGRDDDVGQAIDAFNHMADELKASRDRLVYLTQMTSWQTLARKTAHELKNSLTPIRLTVEEMLARQPAATDRAFTEEATRIVVAEIEALERRVRAFSEFASEPPLVHTGVDLNALVHERVALLRSARPETTYALELDTSCPVAYASADLVSGILTNLLENGAEAAGAGGTVRIATSSNDVHVFVEIHDSGPGLTPEAAASLFEPTITFKKGGMGLGLSIVRKNALLCGGDVTPIAGALGGAAFRVTLPRFHSA